MELEFDKELDAILRRSRGGLAIAANGEHLDADAVVAFAEGALPERARPLYTRHLADCDRCRKLLSHTIKMNTAAVLAADEAASSVVTPAGESSSWLGDLFRTPSLALAMGALVLTFSGVLGYLVLRNQQSDTAMVSQSDTEMQKGGPSAGIEANESMANSNAAAVNTGASAANIQSDVVGTQPASPANAATNSLAKETAPGGAAASKDNGFVLDGVTTDSVKSAPPPIVAEPKPADERDEKKRETEKNLKDKEDTKLADRRQDMDDSRGRDLPATAKKMPGGPTRSGPVQNQSNQINTQTSEMPVTRNAGGKKFTNRSGAWYDTAYRGQATINVRRGSDEYKKLDSGLRSIAENLGGTVVVVWKDKAYRIQ